MNFNFLEAIFSDEAKSNKINNFPRSFEVLENIIFTAKCLEVIRKELGNKPIIVNSWYRSEELNRAVGGSSKSDHPNGNSVDFECPKYGDSHKVSSKILELKNEGKIFFDQLICYPAAHIHISFKEANNRNQVLTFFGKSKYKKGLHRH